jgi:hypothetical protein
MLLSFTPFVFLYNQQIFSAAESTRVTSEALAAYLKATKGSPQNFTRGADVWILSDIEDDPPVRARVFSNMDVFGNTKVVDPSGVVRAVRSTKIVATFSGMDHIEHLHACEYDIKKALGSFPREGSGGTFNLEEKLILDGLMKPSNTFPATTLLKDKLPGKSMKAVVACYYKNSVTASTEAGPKPRAKKDATGLGPASFLDATPAVLSQTRLGGRRFAAQATLLSQQAQNNKRTITALAEVAKVQETEAPPIFSKEARADKRPLVLASKGSQKTSKRSLAAPASNTNANHNHNKQRNTISTVTRSSSIFTMATNTQCSISMVDMITSAKVFFPCSLRSFPFAPSFALSFTSSLHVSFLPPS